MNKKRLVLIKLGGSLITDKHKAFCAKRGVIARVAREIKKSLSPDFDLIIGHGSGSFGHTVASKYQTQKGIINKNSVWGLSLVADAAITINRIVISEFLKAKLPVVSFAPASFLVAKDKKLNKVFVRQIETSLKIGIIPVVYGDIVLDINRGFCIFSGETTLDILAKTLKNHYQKVTVVLCGDTDGVLDVQNKTIERINQKVFKKFSAVIGQSAGVDVTGGMFHKVKTSLDLASKFGIETHIINGRTSQKLKNVLSGKDRNNTTMILGN